MNCRLTIARLLVALLACLALSQCQSKQENSNTGELKKFSYMEPLMGSRFLVVLYAEDQEKADRAAREAFEFAYKVNRACSDYNMTSELMALNEAPAQQPVSLSPILGEVLREALYISQTTKGAYDPTLGRHSYHWRMARKKSALPEPHQIAAAIAASGWQKLRMNADENSITKLTDNMRIDLGGIAKGYTADKMLGVLENNGITQASITAGGELRLGDPPPGKDGWQIELKTLDTKHTLTPKTITLANCGISTSGDLHQSMSINGARYSHVVDPSTGLGLTRRISATVIGPKATLTDALATALCVNPELKTQKVKAMIVVEEKDGSLTLLRNDLSP